MTVRHSSRPYYRYWSRIFVLCVLLVLTQALVLRQSFDMTPKQPQHDSAKLATSTLPVPKHKTVYAIRHGISTANEYMRKPGNQWGDPYFYDNTEIDAPLTSDGRMQARTLLRHREIFDSVELVLVSPLRRCLQTYLEGVHPVCEKKALVLPLLRERVYTQSDTSPFTLADLSQQYPSLDWSEAMKHDEPWHYTTAEHDEYEEWRPYDAEQWYAVPGEPEHEFEKRMGELEMWLRQRPETRILIVSHWGVIRHFTSQEAGNCHIIQFQLENGIEED